MQNLKLPFLLVVFVLTKQGFYAQIAINEDGSPPAASAMLDIDNDSAGILIPRVALTGKNDATTISSPTTGLMIYNTATSGSGSNSVKPGFYFYNGADWGSVNLSTVIEDADGDTKIQVEETADDDIIRFDMAGTEFFRMDSGRVEVLNTGKSVFIGDQAGINDDYSDNLNIAIGDSTLNLNTSGSANVAIGFNSLRANSSGGRNVGIGYNALGNNETGTDNTAIGVYALQNYNGIHSVAIGENCLAQSVSGNDNTGVGAHALSGSISGMSNTAVGVSAVDNNKRGSFNIGIGDYTLAKDSLSERNTVVGYQAGMVSGGWNTGNKSNNVFVGYRSGFSSKTGIGNVFLGYQSGYNELGDNKLYIENSNADSASALIYGEFDNNIVAINGNLGLGTQTPQTKLEIKQGVISLDIDTISADDTTPDISTANTFLTSANSIATAISDLDNPIAGQTVTLICGSATNASTITNGGNFTLSADWTPGLKDVIILLVLADNDYIEIGRVNN